MLPHRFFEGGELPTTYAATTGLVAFNADFRAWLKYERLISLDMDDSERAAAVVGATILSVPPDINFSDLMRAIQWFYSCADVERMEQLDIPPNIRREMDSRKQTASLYWDFWHVWASFKQQHGIDLYAADLHWWEFKRLLGALKADTPLAAVQHLRGLTEMDFKDTEKDRKAKARKDWSETKIDQIFRAIPGVGMDGAS